MAVLLILLGVFIVSKSVIQFYHWSVYVMVRIHLSVSSRLRGLLERERILMVKILNTCILSMLVYNLFLYSTTFYIHRNIYNHRYIGCLHEIEIQFFKKYGYLIGRNWLDTYYGEISVLGNLDQNASSVL